MIIQQPRAVLVRGRSRDFRSGNSTVVMKETLVNRIQCPATVNPSDDETQHSDRGEEEALSEARKKRREKRKKKKKDKKTKKKQRSGSTDKQRDRNRSEGGVTTLNTVGGNNGNADDCTININSITTNPNPKANSLPERRTRNYNSAGKTPRSEIGHIAHFRTYHNEYEDYQVDDLLYRQSVSHFSRSRTRQRFTPNDIDKIAHVNDHHLVMLKSSMLAIDKNTGTSRLYGECLKLLSERISQRSNMSENIDVLKQLIFEHGAFILVNHDTLTVLAVAILVDDFKYTDGCKAAKIEVIASRNYGKRHASLLIKYIVQHLKGVRHYFAFSITNKPRASQIQIESMARSTTKRNKDPRNPILFYIKLGFRLDDDVQYDKICNIPLGTRPVACNNDTLRINLQHVENENVSNIKFMYLDVHTFYKLRKKTTTKYFMDVSESDECELETYNVHIGWHPYTKKEILKVNGVTKRQVDIALSGGEVHVPPGYRRSDEEDGNDCPYQEMIDPKFTQGGEDTCAWSVTCMLVDLICEKTADEMVKMRDNDPKRFSNIHFFKTMGNRIESVHKLLQQFTHFQMRKVNFHVPKHKRLQVLMKKKTGYFVCVIEDMNGAGNHCVGVDCVEQLIYDTVCLKPMKLTMANFIKCAGQYDNSVNGGILGLLDIAQIEKKRTSRV